MTESKKFDISKRQSQVFQNNHLTQYLPHYLL